MKEATGEASMTVIVIILIGILAAVLIPLVTNIMNSQSERVECMNNGGAWTDGTCQTW